MNKPNSIKLPRQPGSAMASPDSENAAQQPNVTRPSRPQYFTALSALSSTQEVNNENTSINNVLRHQLSGSDNHPAYFSSPPNSPPNGPDPNQYTPIQQRLINSRLYHNLRHQTIADIAGHLRDNPDQHASRQFPQPLSRLQNPRSVESLQNMDNYLRDPQYYNPSKRQSHELQFLRQFGSLQSLHPSQHRSVISSLAHCPRHLSAVNESPDTEVRLGDARNHVTEDPNVKSEEDDFTDDEEDEKESDGSGKGIYMPLRKYFTVKEMRNLIGFCHYSLHENFRYNPYKLNPWVYVGIITCVLWCILGKVLLTMFAMHKMMNEPWNAEAEREARQVTDNMLAILPYVSQLVLLMFPPLITQT